MASYTATVSSDRPAGEVFRFLADFRSVARWDPSITEAELLDGGGDPLRVGAAFEVTTSTTLSEVVLRYETIELDEPRRVVLRGENGTLVSIDTITVAERPATGGCDVTYDARLRLKGMLRLLDPLLQLGFTRLGDKARDGLARALNGTGAAPA